MAIHALPKRRYGRNAGKMSRLGEIGVLAKRRDGCEITLVQTQQRDNARQNVDTGDGIDAQWRHRRRIHRRIGLLI